MGASFQPAGGRLDARVPFHEQHESAWFFLSLTALRLTAARNDPTSRSMSALLDVVGAPGALLSVRAWNRLRDPGQHRDFRRDWNSGVASGVRSFGAGTSLLVYYFTRRLFNATAGFWAVLAVNAIPLFNIGNLG